MDVRSTPMDPASALAVRSFSSAEEAVQAVLEAASRVLQLKTTFLTRTDLTSGNLKVLASVNTDPAFVVAAGLELPIEATP